MNQPLHVLFVSTVMAAQTHGPSRKLMLLRKAAAHMPELTIDVITEDPSALYPRDRVLAIKYPRWLEPASKLLRSYRYAQAVHAALTSGTYTHVVYNDAPKALFSAVVSPLRGPQLVVMLNDDDNVDTKRRPYETTKRFYWRRAMHLIERRVARANVCVLCCSDYLATRVQSVYQLSRKPMVLYPALDANEWRQVERRATPRVKPQLLFMKSDPLRGGLQDLLQALSSNELDTEFSALHIGGSNQAIVEQLLARFELNLDIHLHGSLTRAQVLQLTQQCDIGVVCSHHEAYGITAREYCAAGLQAVVSDAGGLPEAVADLEAHLYAAGDVAELAKALFSAKESVGKDVTRSASNPALDYSVKGMARKFYDLLLSCTTV